MWALLTPANRGGANAPSASDPERRPHGHSSARPLPLYRTASEYQPLQTAFQRRNNVMNRGLVQISTLHTGHLSKRRQEGRTRGLRMNRAPGGEQSITPRLNGCRGYDRAGSRFATVPSPRPPPGAPLFLPGCSGEGQEASPSPPRAKVNNGAPSSLQAGCRGRSPRNAERKPHLSLKGGCREPLVPAGGTGGVPLYPKTLEGGQVGQRRRPKPDPSAEGGRKPKQAHPSPIPATRRGGSLCPTPIAKSERVCYSIPMKSATGPLLFLGACRITYVLGANHGESPCGRGAEGTTRGARPSEEGWDRSACRCMAQAPWSHPAQRRMRDG